MQFAKAERKKSKLRLALAGPSGSGKTYGALLVAKGLGGKIAVIDTEKGSASLYSNLVDFDVLELEPPYSPSNYVSAVKLAEKCGYDVVIIDSITHEWTGSGGCLEMNEETAKAKYRGNTWSAWNDTKAKHRVFIDALLSCQAHIIVTMRSKTETAQVEVNGKKQVQKLGMKSEQNDGIEYEFTTVLDLIHDGNFALPSKDRTGLFAPDCNPFKLSEDIGRKLAEWLDSGKNPQDELNRFSEICSTIETMEQLQAEFKNIYLSLKTMPELQSKAKEIYENKKAQLTSEEK
nr:MAG TPA: AAA domain protein [Caudoviricetes sp.]